MKQVWIPEKSEVPAVEVVNRRSKEIIMRVNEANQKYAEVMKGGLSIE